MDFDRQWTLLALEAEHEDFGFSRIARAHNSARAELDLLRRGAACVEATKAEIERLREENAALMAALASANCCYPVRESDDASVAACVRSNSCGCGNAALLTPRCAAQAEGTAA